MDIVGVTEYQSFLPHSISTGARMRAGVARAIALYPDSIFFDEPTMGLDHLSAKDLIEVIKSFI